jgi:hypothetical protein
MMRCRAFFVVVSGGFTPCHIDSACEWEEAQTSGF